MTPEPTTAVVCTAPGRGGIAVITLTGPQAEEILNGVFKPINAHKDAQSNTLQLGHLRDNRTGTTLDKVIVCRTPGGIEINIHGGPHIARRSLELLAGLGAQPHNCDTASAGALDTAHERWNNPSIGNELMGVLPQARSLLVTAALSNQWSGGLSELASGDELPGSDQLRAASDGLKDIRKLLNPTEVVLAGRPNAGKSTLTNVLVGREVSIVHHTAGTTRDWVREPAVINGVPVWITDTAGLFEATEDIDSEAVRRARQCAMEADIVVLLDPDPAVAAPDWLDLSTGSPCVLSVTTKCDQPGGAASDRKIRISAMNGSGIEELQAAIVTETGLSDFDPKTPRAFTTRQSDILLAAADAIDAKNENPSAAREALDQLLRGPISETCAQETC
ncbi:MAG: GTP-binding protein [bacterium]|nr:GTP-binding protein [bacterium]